MDNNDTVNVNSKLTEPRVWGSGSTVLQVGNAIADEQNAIRRKHDEESKEFNSNISTAENYKENVMRSCAIMPMSFTANGVTSVSGNFIIDKDQNLIDTGEPWGEIWLYEVDGEFVDEIQGKTLGEAVEIEGAIIEQHYDTVDDAPL